MGSFSISRLPQTSTLSKNLFAFLSSWRTLGGSVCAYIRGLAPLRNSSSISFEPAKRRSIPSTPHPRLPDTEWLHSYDRFPRQAAAPPSDNFQRTYSSLL